MSTINETVLKNSKGLTIKTIPFGATITSVELPNGRQVVLGFKNLEDYRSNDPYIGCTVGRCTNRTAGAKFLIDGKEYKLSANVSPNHLHGGAMGFNKVLWTQKDYTTSSITYTLDSPDGDQGYPGNLTVTAIFTVTDENEVVLEYRAVTDAPTPVNLTNHSYFNLAGEGNILNHMLTLNANKYTPADEDNIPTGELSSVKDTALDFLTPHSIGERYTQVSNVGYDNNYCLNCESEDGSVESLWFAARLEDSSGSYALQVYTNQPCVQLYIGGYLDGKYIGLNGQPILQYTGMCLETQKHPDAINQPNFPSTLLKPGEEYYSKTVWKFSWPQ